MKDKKSALDALRKGGAKGKEVAKKVTSKKTTPTTQSIVKPQVKLAAKEKQYFNAVATFLEGRGLLEMVDSLTLTMLAKNVCVLRQLYEGMETTEDYFQINPNGVKHASAEANLIKQTEDQILKLSTKLGLSPQDRAKMLGSLAAAEAVKDKRSTDDELSKY